MVLGHLFPDLATYYRVVKSDRRNLRCGKSYAVVFDRVRPTFHIYDPPAFTRPIHASDVSFLPNENRAILHVNQRIRREVLAMFEREHPPVEQSLLFELLPYLKSCTSIQLASIKKLGLTIPMQFLNIRIQHRSQDVPCFHGMCQFIRKYMQLEELRLDILSYKSIYPPSSRGHGGPIDYTASFNEHHAQYVPHPSETPDKWWIWWCEITAISGLKKLSIKEIWQRSSADVNQVYYEHQSEKDLYEALTGFLKKMMVKPEDEEHS